MPPDQQFTVESMQQKWERMSKSTKYEQIAPALKSGLENLCKWYQALDNSNIYFICLILDPHVKMAYFGTHWEDRYLEDGKESLEKMVCQLLFYANLHN